MSTKAEELEQELAKLVSWEYAGYVCYGRGPAGGVIATGSATPGQVTFHFAVKADIRAELLELQRKEQVQ